MTLDFRVVPFKAHHYEWLRESNPTADGGLFVATRSVLEQLERQNSWTGVVDGNPIVCAGTYQQWPGRHTAWAYLGKSTGPHMHWITKQVLANLEKLQGRVELTVRQDFPVGQRWAKMLGFRVETPLLERFGPQGESHVGFVRIN